MAQGFRTGSGAADASVRAWPFSEGRSAPEIDRLSSGQEICILLASEV